ncbi:hypothetical protein [Tritonibacter mobilis]|uniref:hypothetical protein n=1 Tax=Tritonibacter mobilis TaxID=379347 RepID=UPI001CD97EF0|nr:hypothetical protein [Tritonibacter mobilis]MCA2008184.1 hypothetical protein [Tritonibacter mobilis]
MQRDRDQCILTLTIDEALHINDRSGSFIFGKSGLGDYSPGVFMGRTTAQGGSVGFGLHAGRDSDYIRVSKDTGLEIRNAKFSISTGTASQQSITSSASVPLAAGSKSLTLQLLGGGKGGSASQHVTPAGNGGDTIVLLRDGSTNIATFTAGGATSHVSGQYGQVSADNPYGNGGHGSSGASGGSDEAGYWNIAAGKGGSAGEIKTFENIDVSGLSNPILQITVGHGGAGATTTSSSRRGTSGGQGRVIYSSEGHATLPAGVISQAPAVSGSMSVNQGDNQNFNRFPDLGPGMWAVQGSFWKIVDGHSIHPDVRTFAARTRPGVTYNGTGNHSVAYYFWPIK